MRYKELMSYVRSKQPQHRHVLSNCAVIVDGNSYFHGTYRNESGCKYILGAECDRYTSYLKKKLSCFSKSNVICYFVFKGAAKTDLDRREYIHQKVIDRANAFHKGDEDVYYEPILLSNVCKQVLHELKIRYFVSEFKSTEAIITLAHNLNCPVITYSLEFSLFGVTVIGKRIKFDEETSRIFCDLYKPDEMRALFYIDDCLLPMLLTIVDEESKYFDILDKNLFLKPRHLLPKALWWLKNKTKNEAMYIVEGLLNDDEKQSFHKCYDKEKKLFDLGINYYKGKKLENAFSKSDKGSFEKAVWDGKIEGTYVALVQNKTLSGSWLIFDATKDDAMLPTIDIVTYAYMLLTNNNEKLKITFIGRKQEIASVWEIDNNLNITIPNEKFFKGDHEVNARYNRFINKTMPGFDLELLQTLPEDCRILIITLVYFFVKTNEEHTYGYSIILSYVLLGPVSDQVGLIDRDNVLLKNSVSHKLNNVEEDTKKDLKYEDCISAANALMESFYIENITDIFSRKILHNFSVFQHCLQHMNYLNKVCGEGIPCTIYEKCYNATLVYNTFMKIKDMNNPIEYFDNCLKDSSTVLLFFKQVTNVLNNCISSVQTQDAP